MEVAGKIAVVTGAASGIGSATCKVLVEQGIKAIGAVDQVPAVGDLCSRLNEAVGREVMHPFVGTVIDTDFRQSVFDKLKALFEVVDLCVPAAGITRDRLSVRIDKETQKAQIYSQDDFDAVLQVNLTAPIYWALETIASQAVHRARRGLGAWQPKEGMQGSIVLIGSVSSAGNRGQISYATTKAGLEGAQATLAKEAIFYGVRCSIIHPGYTDTPMVRALGEEHIRDRIVPNTLLKRLLRPEEVADSILFMLTNSAASGSLWVDAGWVAIN